MVSIIYCLEIVFQMQGKSVILISQDELGIRMSNRIPYSGFVCEVLNCANHARVCELA